MDTDKSWERAEDILCVRLDSIGDVLMTTPAMRALKESQPGRRITLLTSPAGAEVADLIPEIDEVIAYDAPWMKASASRSNSHPEYVMADRLYCGGFDAAVIFTVYSQNPLPSAFLCYLADIPLRLAHCHENPYQLLTNWVVDPEPNRLLRHEVRRQLDLVATVGCYTEDERLSLRVPEVAEGKVRRLLSGLGVRLERPWAVMHPGATCPSRRYPWEYYAQVSRRLISDFGWQIIFTGSGDEDGLVQRIQAAIGAPSHSLAGCLSLAELAALVSLSPILISNNTGPVHIAAAVGTPVVDLYALTNPQHTPWGVPNRVLSHNVPCQYCYKSICPEGHNNCLRKVAPNSVIRAARELVAETLAIPA